MGPKRGVIQTGSKNQRNPDAPTVEERSIDWTVRTEISLDIAQAREHNSMLVS